MKVIVAELSTLRKNLNTIRERVGSAEVVADLSADGQGLGLLRMARFLTDSGVQSFAVTETRDAVNLRRSGFTQEHILMLRSITDAQELRELMECGVTFTLGSNEAAIALNGLSGELHTVAEARIRVDTGLGQYGFLPVETENMLSLFRHMPGIAVTGVYTRMSGTDRKSASERQYSAFTDVIKTLRAQGADTGSLMALDLSGVLLRGAGEQNAVLVGPELIGRAPEKIPGLAKVGTVEVTMEGAKWLPEGTVLGAGRGRKLRKATRTAVVDLGWANGVGVIRSNDRQEMPLKVWKKLPIGRFRPVFRVNGKRVKMLGQAGVSSLLLDVTKCECAPGDRAVLDADPRMLKGIPVELRE